MVVVFYVSFNDFSRDKMTACQFGSGKQVLTYENINKMAPNNYCHPVNSMWITGTITAKQKVRQKVPGLYAVCR